MIVNHRVPVTKLRTGDLFIAIHRLPTSEPRSYGVIAEVREVSNFGNTYTVSYTATDDPTGTCYGSDITLRRGDTVTVITITN